MEAEAITNALNASYKLGFAAINSDWEANIQDVDIDSREQLLQNIQEAIQNFEAFDRKLQTLPTISYTYEEENHTMSILDFEMTYTFFKTTLSEKLVLLPKGVQSKVESMNDFFDVLKQTYADFYKVKNDHAKACSLVKTTRKDHQDHWDQLSNHIARKKKFIELANLCHTECQDLSGKLWTTENIFPFTITEQTRRFAKELLENQEKIINDKIRNTDNIWLAVLKITDYERYGNMLVGPRCQTNEPEDFDWHIPVTIFGKVFRYIDVYFEDPKENRCVITSDFLFNGTFLDAQRKSIDNGTAENTIGIWIAAMKLKHKIKTLYYNHGENSIHYSDASISMDAEVMVFGKKFELPSGIKRILIGNECSESNKRARWT